MNSASDPFAPSARFRAKRSGNRASLILFLYIGLFASVKGWGAPSPQLTTGLDIERLSLETLQLLRINWRVAGRVMTLKGSPIPGAKIQVEVGSEPRRPLQADLQGFFQTDYELRRDAYPKLRVRVTATKGGYQPATETVEYPANNKAWEIQVILRKKDEELVPPLTDLVTILAPKLLTAATQDKEIDTRRKEFQRGTEKFVSLHKSIEALPDLQKVTDRWPKCVECRTLLGLAELDAGYWASALREIDQVAGGSDHPKEVRLAAPFVILGVMEEWRGYPANAAHFFSQALAIEPGDLLALTEMGRALINQHDWQAASQPLEKAVKVGVSPEARVLLAQVQFELGKNEAAAAELARFREDRKTKTPSPAARAAYAELEQQLKLEARNEIIPLVSGPLPEIQKALPELQALEAASSQDALPEILRRTGESVDLFFRTFPNTISQEDVCAQRLGKEGKVAYSLDQSFQYLVVVKYGKARLSVDEYRGDSRGRPISVQNPERRFMLTRGFTSLSLVFHPSFQAYTKFRYLGTQSLLGRKTAVIAFAQTNHNTRILEEFIVGTSTVLVLQQGVAWIDAESFQILRMRTDLLKPQPELKLRRQTTEVTYDRVQFKEEPLPWWLPREVAVTVEMRGRSWHNLHRYSAFRLFRVATKDKIAVPQPVDVDQPADSD